MGRRQVKQVAPLNHLAAANINSKKITTDDKLVQKRRILEQNRRDELLKVLRRP